MNWEPINRYARPIEAWDYNEPKILVYSPTLGILMVRCIKEDDGSGDDGVRYSFRYDRDGYEVTDATHYMPLPPHP